jgi:uncharacterized protein YcbK (DUF882 family)
MLKMIFALGAQSLIPYPWAEAEASLTTSHHLGNLSLYNEHTGESISIRYFNKRHGLDRKACHRLNHFFRCTYDGTVHPIDPKLFLLLDTVHCILKAERRPFHLVSGYRSPSYNRLLCCEDANVAHHSYHMKGMAADVYMDGATLRDIERVAKRLKVGGVGNYSDFVHLDVGPVRTW